MATNLQIDDNLLQEALKLSEHQDKNVVVEEALKEYILHRKQLQVVDLFGTIDYEEEYAYKTQRQRK